MKYIVQIYFSNFKELGSENGHPSNLQAPMMNGDVGNLSNGNGENASVNSAHVLQIIESSENLARLVLYCNFDG